MISLAFHRLRYAFPFLLAIGSLALIFWATDFQLHRGYEGFDWTPLSGAVLDVDPLAPASESLRVGDRIVSVEGVPAILAPQIHANIGPGDTVHYLIERDRSQFAVDLRMADLPPRVVFQSLVPLAIAATFWAIGLAVLSFGQAGAEARPFFRFCLIASGVLGAGSLSTAGPIWSSTLFNILLWFAGPIAVDLHLRFPEARRHSRAMSAVLYGGAILGSLPFLLLGATGVRASAWSQLVFTSGRLFLSGNLLLVVWLLLSSYRRATSVQARQRIRLVALGGGAGMLLVIVLSILPGALTDRPLVPYEVSFAFLIALPASYGYAIARHRLIRLERFLSRGAAYTLVFAILAAIYLGVTTALDRLFSDELLEQPLINMLVILLLAATAVVIYRRIQALVDFAFYGGWYDYRSAVARITEGLEEQKSSEELAATLSTRLQATLRLERACVFVATRDGSLAANGCELPDEAAAPASPLALPAQGQVVQYLKLNPRPVSAEALRQSLLDRPLTRDERGTLLATTDCLMVPVAGSDGLLAVMALGRRRGGEGFSAEDLDILDLVARHAGAAIENVRLTGEVRQHVVEVEQLHKRLLRAREEERKSLARELHDEAIQSLVGMNYRLAHLESGQTQTLRQEVLRIVEELRGMIHRLRPPALDNFGLVTAVRSELRERSVRSHGSRRIDLHVEGDPELGISEEVGLCLYRVMQEALNNIERHSEAAQVDVALVMGPEEIRLSVRDNGKGFPVPQQLGLLLEADHFGLVGVRERLELLHGTLEIDSAPGSGTTLRARIPLESNSSGPA
ncbi:MAG TPA: ATP-binding protein [Anaerolineales bacterium]|nr:ATP-binding protein [Anaerolineales bacterium]